MWVFGSVVDAGFGPALLPSGFDGLGIIFVARIVCSLSFLFHLCSPLYLVLGSWRGERRLDLLAHQALGAGRAGLAIDGLVLFASPI